MKKMDSNYKSEQKTKNNTLKKSKSETKLTDVKYKITDGKLCKIKTIKKSNNIIFTPKNNKIEIKNNITNLQKKIKSYYIMKKIFSFITIKNKFKLIIYNKEFQKKLKIDIEDYKKESGKYKIGEKNGKGIEYDLYTNKKIICRKLFKW